MSEKNAPDQPHEADSEGIAKEPPSSDDRPADPEPGREGEAAPYALEPPGDPHGPSLIDDFEDDADFTEDPEVEAALGGSQEPKTAARAVAPGRPVLARDGWDPPKAVAIAGGVITIPALIASWITATSGPDAEAMDGLIAALLTLYNTGLHTITGVAAVLLSAVLLHLTPGRVEVIAARLLMAVATFQAIAHVNLGYGLPILLGVLGYLLVLALLMRTTRDRLFVVSAAHLLLVGITQLGMMLYAAADARAAG